MSADGGHLSIGAWVLKLAGFTRTEMRDKLGTTVANNSNCFRVVSSAELASPVTLRPGRLMLAMTPLPIGSFE